MSADLEREDGDKVCSQCGAIYCPCCGHDCAPESDPALLKLGEHNQKARESFEVIDIPFEEDQYFVVYGMTEWEEFKPEQIFGIWGAQELAISMSYFRSTGVLRIPLHRSREGWQYKNVQPKWVHFLTPEASMLRQTVFK